MMSPSFIFREMGQRLTTNSAGNHGIGCTIPDQQFAENIVGGVLCSTELYYKPFQLDIQTLSPVGSFPICPAIWLSGGWGTRLADKRETNEKILT